MGVPVPGMRANVKYHKGWGDFNILLPALRGGTFYQSGKLLQKLTDVLDPEATTEAEGERSHRGASIDHADA